MNIELWLAIIAIVSTPVGGAIGAVLMRRKYKVEIDKQLTEVTSNELENVRQGNDILMKQIVEPLKTEIKYLRTDVNKFRKAIEKIPGCPYSPECPVSAQLQSDETGGDGDTKGHD